jgi:5-oxoprolinase (ATP-hydrolysing)
VVTPVHDEGGRIRFFTASRGHHADVGGVTPGSMPPFSRTLEEEGIVLGALRVVRSGRLDEAAVLAALTAGPYPARRPRENLADLEAQIAANRAGDRLLRELARRYGLPVVEAYMQHVQDNAAAKVAEAIARLPRGKHRFEDALDDGTPIRVTLRIDGDRMEVDFAGSGAEVDGNLNAPRAVTVAAVIYVLRALVGEPIPLNAGCLRHVTLSIPEGSILSPSPVRPVAGGNVETSQRIVDVLLGALGKAAASQGTMNNLTFGDGEVAYYETIAGGAGAGPGFDGASGVHTHMTNTRATDPEVLEALPGATRGVLDPPRLGWRRAVARRRRPGAGDRDPPTDAGGDPLRAPFARPLRSRGWPARGAGAEPPQRPGDPGKGGAGRSGGRPDPDRDARGRRVRDAVAAKQ